MDMSLRDWLIIIGAVILAGILLDGYRRMLRAKRDSLEISRSMGGSFEQDQPDDDYNPELPSGGARIVRRNHANYAEGGAVEQDDQNTSGSAAHLEEFRADREEPDFDMAGSDELVAEQDPRSASLTPAPAPRGRFPDAVKVLEETESASPQVSPLRESADKKASTLQQAVASDRIQSVRSAARNLLRKDKAEPARKPENNASKTPQEIIIINVLSKDEEGFDGGRLQRLVEACGMEFGEESVFSRHEYGFGAGPVQFGMASLTDRGTFDIETMDRTSVPGVCFYLTLPGPDDSMKAFEYMLETAHCVVRNLNGEMKDERRSVFTQQTIEHCRQRIREFERRQQLAARV